MVRIGVLISIVLAAAALPRRSSPALINTG